MMELKAIILTLCLFGIVACGANGSGDELSSGELKSRILPADSEILSTVYNRLYHVKDPSASFELCTDDYQQALDWDAPDCRSVQSRFDP